MPINLPDGTQVKQRQVDKSASVSDNLAVPTLSYASQKSLEDDLNYLRSILKQVKGTVKYDSPLTLSLEGLYTELQQAVFHNAVLTGVPVATETIPPGDYSDRVSTTQFVNDVVNNYLSGQPGDARKVMNATNPITVGSPPNVQYVWYFEHNLGKYPSVTLLNTKTPAEVIFGSCEFLDQTDTLSLNHLRVTLASEQLGKVILN